jgi:endonuclease/exonuclease/phosphatase (EEP) superfamily protein YafD
MRKATDDDGAMRQNRQAKELGKITAAFDVPFLLVGDMNATPMSAAFNTILSETGTEQTYKAWFATWPTVLGKLGIPIDHVLTKGKISVQVELGPSGGSDHYPLGIMVAIP